MKKTIGFVVIIAALVLGSYYGMGLITERTLKRNIEVIKQTNNILITITQYERGFFTSKAMLNWRLHVPARVSKDANDQPIIIHAEDYDMDMPLSICHGPVILADAGVRFGLGYAHSDLELPKKYADKFTTLFASDSTQPRIVLGLFVNYLNNSQLHLDIPAFKLVAKEGGDQFVWDGMQNDLNVSSSLQHIAGHMMLDGMSLIKNKMKVLLSHLSSEYNLHQTDSGLYLGEASLSLPSLTVMENKQKILDVEKFQVETSSQIENGLFDSNFKTSLDKITALDKSYGPALLALSIKHLDAEVLAKINDDAAKLQKGPANQRQQALLGMLPDLPKLFAKGAEFEISSLSFVMPEGAVDGNLLVSLPKGDSGNPFQLLQKVKGRGMLKMPVVFVRDVLKAAAKKKLMAQSTLQDAMVQQMQKNNQSAVPGVSDTTTSVSGHVEKTTATTATTEETTPAIPVAQDSAAPVSIADVEQQAAAQAEQKLTSLVQAGLLSLQGTDYVIRLNLAEGQLTVNGKPFNAAMMQF